MKFPKPTFEELFLEYKTNPESVHDCPRIYRKDPEPNVSTCAVRMSEALVLANRIIGSRAAITSLTSHGGTGEGFLLGRYGYRVNLCPHGLGRGVADVAYFLQEHWGRPNHAWRGAHDKAPGEIIDKAGLLFLMRIPGHDGQGVVDVWDKKKPVGPWKNEYWKADKGMFWTLD